MALKFKRIFLKLSGEVFEGEGEFGIDGASLLRLASEIKEVSDAGVEIGIVNGGGNFWRYRDFKGLDFLDRVSSDTMGMLATIMNALAFEAALKKVGADARAVCALPCPNAIETYNISRARDYMEQGKIVIFAGGTGSPYFTTDSAAALRALEMECDVLMKATKVDYVYDKDPIEFADAKKFEEITFQKVIEMGLKVMDLTCASLCNEGKMPMIVFNLTKEGNIMKAVNGEKIGTFISF